MALTLPRVIGRDVTVTLTGGQVTNWDKISISLPDDDFEATSAQAAYKQFVVGQNGQATISISGFLGVDDSTLPASGDAVSAIDIAVATDTLLPSDIATKAVHGIWKVKNPKYDFQAGAATFSFEIKSGYLA